MNTFDRTVPTRVVQRVRSNAVAGLLAAYVTLLCVGTVLGPLLLTVSLDMSLVSAMRHTVGVVGATYLIGVGLLLR